MTVILSAQDKTCDCVQQQPAAPVPLFSVSKSRAASYLKIVVNIIYPSFNGMVAYFKKCLLTLPLYMPGQNPTEPANNTGSYIVRCLIYTALLIDSTFVLSISNRFFENLFKLSWIFQ